MVNTDEKYMRIAIREALKAKSGGNYSIGAVIIKEGKIIANSPNITRSKNDPTKHAEIEAIRKALKKEKQRFLEGCVLYTTHEPCPMCATAAVWVKLKRIVYGARMRDMIKYSKTNKSKHWRWRTVQVPAQYILSHGNPKVRLTGGILRKQCVELFHS